MQFHERLKTFRESIGVNKKRDMADRLEVSESFYNRIENGNMEPSKNFLPKLVIVSNKPEEYWLYGVTNKNDYLEIRSEWKCMNEAFEALNRAGLLNVKSYSDDVKEVLLAAALADIDHMKEKKQQGL